MNTIESLYYGNLCPGDKTIIQNSEYDKLLKTLNNLNDKLNKEISEEAQKILKEYEDVSISFNALCDKESFLEGFRIGAKLILDILLEY